MKRVFAGLLIMITALGASAQGKYGKTQKDSISCIEALNIYVHYVKNDIPLALKHWRIAVNVCPKSSKNLYINGAKMYQTLIKNNKENKEVASKYVDTLMWVYDMRMEHFGQKCYVLGRKGGDLLKYRKSDPHAAYLILKESMECGGEKTDPGALYYLIVSATRSHKKEKITLEEMIDIFGKAMDNADKAIAKLKAKGDEKSKKKIEKYVDAEERMVKNIGPFLTGEIVKGLVNKNYDTNKDNLAWLKLMARLMKAKEVSEGVEFEKVVVRIDELEPSCESSARLGQMFIRKKEYSKAIEYFKKAAECPEATDDEKADYYYGLAIAENFAGQKGSARTHANKAASLREGFGKPYILIGNMYAASAGSVTKDDCNKGAVFCLAADMMNKAAATSTDENVKKDARSKAAAYAKRFPSQKDCFFLGYKGGETINIGGWIGTSVKLRFRSE